jgi:hypothetical protein
MHIIRLHLILFLTLGPLLAIGQRTSDWAVGARAGATLAGVNRSAIRSYQGIPLDNISTQTVQTFHIGLIISRQLGSRWSVQTELLYNQYGGRADATASLGAFTTGVSTVVRLNTLEVPVLLQRSFGRGRLGGFVNAGGFGAYSVSSEVTINSTSLAGFIPDVNRKLIYGVVGGAGATLRLGPGRMLLEGRFSYSLGDNVDLDFGGTKLHYQIALGSVGYIVDL